LVVCCNYDRLAG